jgi:hypothetical protein
MLQAFEASSLNRFNIFFTNSIQIKDQFKLKNARVPKPPQMNAEMEALVEEEEEDKEAEISDESAQGENYFE